MIGRLALSLACMSVPGAATAQAVIIESNASDPKVLMVNQLLEVAQSSSPSNRSLTDIVAKGATIHKFGPDLLPLNLSSLRAAFDKCEPSIDGERLEVGPKKLSVWMRCPTGPNGTFVSANVVEFGFKGRRISSIQFIVVVIQAPGSSS